MKRAIVLVAVLLTACSTARAAPSATPATHAPSTTAVASPEQDRVLSCIAAVEATYLAAEQRRAPDVAGLRSTCVLAAYGPGGIGRAQQQAIADIGHLIDELDPHVLPLNVTAGQRAAAFATLQSARGAFNLTGR